MRHLNDTYGKREVMKKRMELDYYLWKNKLTQKEFAEQIGIAPHSLCLIVNKKSYPSLITAINIFRATRGQVSYEELLNENDKKKLIDL